MIIGTSTAHSYVEILSPKLFLPYPRKKREEILEEEKRWVMNKQKEKEIEHRWTAGIESPRTARLLDYAVCMHPHLNRNCYFTTDPCQIP
ncbi:hypothetical protein ES288_A07G036400v1 [Gossypium darwinii]|uniref:Uncharacterized protein n=1 Tax=Gossypium darwinii TaxID=34276 RepID=A0A5D2FT92_GOSDA|nr:hypothetical protein ES288_A07G036400v1 [Gossypium darwinii]